MLAYNKTSDILIEHHKVQPELQHNRVKTIYMWAQKNGYNEIWRPNVV